MRDPNRIDTMLAQVARIWRANPDLRLGQIVTNAALANSPKSAAEVFFIEDDVLATRLDELFPPKS